MDTTSTIRTVLITGCSSGIGLCLAHGLRSAGYHVFATARKEDDVVKFIKEIEANIGAIEVAIYNIGGNIKFGITETTSQKYYKTWEMAAFGAFLIRSIISSIEASATSNPARI